MTFYLLWNKRCVKKKKVSSILNTFFKTIFIYGWTIPLRSLVWTPAYQHPKQAISIHNTTFAGLFYRVSENKITLEKKTLMLKKRKFSLSSKQDFFQQSIIQLFAIILSYRGLYEILTKGESNSCTGGLLLWERDSDVCLMQLQNSLQNNTRVFSSSLRGFPHHSKSHCTHNAYCIVYSGDLRTRNWETEYLLKLKLRLKKKGRVGMEHQFGCSLPPVSESFPR